MTQSDDTVSRGPHTAGATSLGGDSRHGRRHSWSRGARRGLLAVPVALTLMAPAGPALAQTTGTSGYKQSPPTPTTSTPKSGTAPSKEATTPVTTTPKASTEPATTTTTPTATTAVSPSESKLPFTGLDLRWVVGAGILLLAAGLSIRIAQRRQRYGGR
jgi:uncharacterized membrane protein